MRSLQQPLPGDAASLGAGSLGSHGMCHGSFLQLGEWLRCSRCHFGGNSRNIGCRVSQATFGKYFCTGTASVDCWRPKQFFDLQMNMSSSVDSGDPKATALCFSFKFFWWEHPRWIERSVEQFPPDKMMMISWLKSRIPELVAGQKSGKVLQIVQLN